MPVPDAEDEALLGGAEPGAHNGHHGGHGRRGVAGQRLQQHKVPQLVELEGAREAKGGGQQAAAGERGGEEEADVEAVGDVAIAVGAQRVAEEEDGVQQAEQLLPVGAVKGRPAAAALAGVVRPAAGHQQVAPLLATAGPIMN